MSDGTLLSGSEFTICVAVLLALVVPKKEILVVKYQNNKVNFCENRMKYRGPVFEFIANRLTDRRDGGLCFIILSDSDVSDKLECESVFVCLRFHT